MAINTLFEDIADAIRAKAGTSGLITPAQMPAAIAAIPSGGSYSGLEIFTAFCTGTYQGGKEYPSYIYNTDILDICNIDLLYDASQGGITTGSIADISNYDAIVLQGIYRETRTSQYNTSILYENVELNHAYWAGMKDRNSSYTCNVTFDSLTSFVLSGANKEVIIYGIGG